MIRIILPITAILSCVSTEEDMGTVQYSICETHACSSYAEKLKNTLNTESLNICDDVFNSVCEGWRKKTFIPDSQTEISQVSLLKDKANEKISGILFASDQPDDPQELKNARMVFRMCMDQEQRDTDGLTPLNKLIMGAGGWPMILPTETENVDPWQEASKAYNHLGIRSGLFEMVVDFNDRNSSEHMIYIIEPEFLLSRDTFVNSGSHKNSLKVYRKYIKEIANALAEDRGVNISNETLENDVTNIINMQTMISNIISSSEEAWDIQTQLKHMTISELQKIYDDGGPKTDIAHIDFLDMIRNEFARTQYQIDASQEVIVSGPKYFSKLATVLNGIPSRTIVNTIHMNSIMKLTEYTTSKMNDIMFEARKQLFGVKEQEKEWRSCLQLPNFEHALAFKYAKDNFHSSAKNKVLTIMNEMKEAVNTQIREAQWLDDATKNAAIEKVNAMVALVGYADWYSDEAISNYYKHLKFEAPFFFDTVIKLNVFERDKELLKLREPTDRNNFFSLPYEVQATYRVPTNSILITAAFLQDPIYNEDFPDSLNYATVAYILGHEISHGFDDIGGAFDKNGYPSNWWSSEALEGYATRAKCFIEQYNKYIVHDMLPLNKTVYVNGEVTLRENIGDTMGIRSAWNTWQMYKNVVNNQLKTDVRLPGLENITADQLFFIGAVFMTCEKKRPSAAEFDSMEDVHSPWHTRVVGSMSNMYAFSETFDCADDSGMNPVDKCSLWR